MTDTATQLLATFESLPAKEQHELLAQMLRCSRNLPGTPMSDLALTTVADELFQSLDTNEADGEHANAG